MKAVKLELLVRHSVFHEHEGHVFECHSFKINEQNIIPVLPVYSDERVARATHNTYDSPLKDGKRLRKNTPTATEWGAGTKLLDFIREHNINLIQTQFIQKKRIGCGTKCDITLSKSTTLSAR